MGKRSLQQSWCVLENPFGELQLFFFNSKRSFLLEFSLYAEEGLTPYVLFGFADC